MSWTTHPSPRTAPQPCGAAISAVKSPGWQRAVASTHKRYAMGAKLAAFREGEGKFNQQRVDRARPCPTIGRMGGASLGTLSHWAELRVLTPRELAACQGFPPAFRWRKPPGSEQQAFTRAWAVVGNAVPPPLMEAVAGNLARAPFIGKGRA